MRSAETVLGPFRVDRNGLLSPASADRMPSFAVRFRDRVVQARISADGEAAGILHLTTRAGRVPSTASLSTANPSTGQQARATALGLVQELPETLPPSWRLRLSADHSIVMEARTTLRLPVSAVGLVVEMSSFLLRLQPYLDVLDGEGMGLGITRTCPG